MRKDCLVESLDSLVPEPLPALPLEIFLESNTDAVARPLIEREQSKTFQENMTQAGVGNQSTSVLRRIGLGIVTACEAKKKLGADIRAAGAVVDVAGGQHKAALLGIAPTLTASRCQSSSYYLPGHGRMLTTGEMALLQGNLVPL